MNRQKIIILYVIAITLFGCATSFSTFDKAFPKLIDKNISEAVTYLGMPSKESNILGKKIYIWTTRESYVGFKVDAHPVELDCTLRIITVNNKIESYDYDGANGTCFRFSNKLKPLAP